MELKPAVNVHCFEASKGFVTCAPENPLMIANESVPFLSHYTCLYFVRQCFLSLVLHLLTLYVKSNEDFATFPVNLLIYPRKALILQISFFFFSYW